jgi:hypothetical protein
MYDLPTSAGNAAFSSAVWLPGFTIPAELALGPNDGGIKRGDRSDTGDNEARGKPEVGQGGSGVGDSTADPSSIGTGPGAHNDRTGELDVDEGLQIRDENDPDLGITSGDAPGDDWAANTGQTRNPPLKRS